LPETIPTNNPPSSSDDTSQSNDTEDEELPESSSSQTINIPTQTMSDNPAHMDGNSQLELKVDDNEVDNDKN